MKVLMLGWEFPPRVSGGLGTACRGITKGLASVGTEVLFVLPTTESRSETPGLDLLSCERVPIMEEQRWRSSQARQVLGVSCDLDPYSGRSFRRTSSAKDFYSELERYTRAVGEIARLRSFDVIHAHDWMSFSAGLFAKELTGKPLVLHVHSLECDRAGAESDARVIEIERAGLNRCDQVVCVSHATARAVELQYGVESSRIRVVHNAVDLHVAELDRATDSDLQRVLFLGRITQQKDPATFLEAAALILQSVPATQFVVAGDGDLLPDMVRLTHELGIERSVRFTGFLDETQVGEMYDLADVFVMSSRSEPFGLVSLEAMAHGVPVVATRGSGVLETLTSALVVDVGDVCALAEQVVALLTRPALRESVIAAGAVEVRTASWERRGEQLSELYEELVG